MATAGKAIDTVAGLPAVSFTVTVAFAALAFAAVGVPLIAPVVPSMPRPGGWPVTPYDAMSLSLVLGVTAPSATPTCSDAGAV